VVVDRKQIVLLPPMGHCEKFFTLLRDHLEDDFIVHTLNYPVIETKLKSSILEEYITYFCNELNKIEGEFILGGLSLGATLSLRIKDKLGDKVSCVVLMASGGLKVARARKEMVQHHINNITSREFFIGKALSLDSLGNFLLHFNNDLSELIAREYFDNVLSQRWEKKYDGELGRNFVQAAAEAIEVNYEGLLEKHQSSIHMLWGMKDRVFSQRYLRRFQKLMPNAKFHHLNNCGHYLPLESSEECAKILLNLCKL
jgi:pimeloyl-ACP methyl ester carboxylesterase